MDSDKNVTPGDTEVPSQPVVQSQFITSSGNYFRSLKNKRWLMIILPILVVLVGVLMIIKQKPAPTSPAVQIPSLSGLEIAKQTINFLNQTASSSGDFNKAYNCSNANKSSIKCQAQPDAISNQPNNNQARNTDLSEFDGLIIRAYIDIYNKTGDSKYLAPIQNGLAFILQKCDAHIIYCANSLPGLYAWYKQTNDPKYKQLIANSEVTLLKRTSVEDDIIRQEAEYYWMMYDVTGDPRVKAYVETDAKTIMAGNLDKTKFNSSLGLIYKDGNFEVNGYQIIAQGWLIAAYQVTKDPTYLNAAQDFFDKAKLGSHEADFVKITSGLLNLNSTEYLLNLADVSSGNKQQDYINQAQALTQSAVINLWDNKTNEKFNGDSGFLQNFQKNNGDANSKITFQNAFRVRQLLRLSDKTFNLK